jgi:hypothetical protein
MVRFNDGLYYELNPYEDYGKAAELKGCIYGVIGVESKTAIKRIQQLGISEFIMYHRSIYNWLQKRIELDIRHYYGIMPIDTTITEPPD